MTKKKFWLGILVMVLTFGMTVVGCEEDSTDSTDEKKNDGITIGNWTWNVYNDSTNGGTSTITMTQGTGADSNKLTFSGNVTNGYEYGYVGIYPKPNETEFAKLKTAASISFKVKGDGKEYRLLLRTSDITDYSDYQTRFTAGTTETTVTINISTLAGPGWGQSQSKPFNQNNVTNLFFERTTVVGGTGPFNITISDLTLNNSSGGAMTWTTVSNSTFGNSYQIDAIAFGNGKFVAGGQQGEMATSTDGIIWTTGTNSTFLSATSQIHAIVYGNDKFVAVGNNSTMAYSSDGTTWKTITKNPYMGDIYAIAYGNGKFVAVGGNSDSDKIAYSSDGITWNTISNTPFTYRSEAIAFGNGKFVAGGQQGEIVTSTDGIIWTAVTNSTFGSSRIRAIAFGNDKFVACNHNGKMAYSSDGITWTAVTNSTFGTDTILAITYGNGKFVAGSFNGKMAYSSDGITWTAEANSPFGNSPPGTFVFILGIAYGNGKFVAVGSYNSHSKIAYSSGN